MLNKVDGKCYIGSTNCIRTRIMTHLRDLRKNNHGNQRLQTAWNSYGEESFVFELMEKCQDDRLMLMEREQHYMDTNVSDYNVCKHANMSQHSQESKDKIRSALTGKKKTDTHRIAMSASRVGRPSGRKGKVYDIPDNTRSRMGDTWRGKTLPEETRIKMSNTRKGRKTSDEHKRNISISIKERYANPTKAMLDGFVKASIKKKQWRWITNGIENKRIHESQLGDIEAGFVLGRTIKIG